MMKEYELAPDSPIVIDVELSFGSGTFANEDGLTTLSMYKTDVVMSNGSTGPVVYSPLAMLKLYIQLGSVFGLDPLQNPEKFLRELKDKS